MTVADLAGTAAFYRNLLGLEVGPEQALDPAWNCLLGLKEGTVVRAADVAIGQQVIKLVAFDPPGLEYPSERASNDQWFQHVALVSGDITSLWERLTGGSPGVITKGSPVRLPANTGGVTAFKFRDPEGHPLELIFFPRGVGDPQWQGKTASGIVGYDHTAIATMDVGRSVAFYTELLGFKVGARSLNTGVEQDRLDGLRDCQLDVVALEPASRVTPHVELLHYRRPPGRTSTSEVRANDVASARQIHNVDDLDALVGRLETEGVTFVSPGMATLKDGRKAATIRDPDGHMIVLME
ncbi:VOC family protein [Bradyrhizobium sp. LHD-71]|uniref:VOC family protein n=1 Tax=Bradyrhizobium sp. LHD-71 TaxID=3072141 RepID=UPI00280D33E9|nr:VOC family protein [Bradyrhizobium sp. LHD-71]MDQ8728254.1 VOC family protein [Bradyrhizobium sp. LHD-71]